MLIVPELATPALSVLLPVPSDLMKLLLLLERVPALTVSVAAPPGLLLSSSMVPALTKPSATVSCTALPPVASTRIVPALLKIGTLIALFTPLAALSTPGLSIEPVLFVLLLMIASESVTVPRFTKVRSSANVPLNAPLLPLASVKIPPLSIAPPLHVNVPPLLPTVNAPAPCKRPPARVKLLFTNEAFDRVSEPLSSRNTLLSATRLFATAVPAISTVP